MKTSAQDVVTVDTGSVSSKKRTLASMSESQFHARTGIGPGVFMSGDHAANLSAAASDAAAVRHGNPSVAVPL